MNAQVDDAITIRIVGVNPERIPNAIEVTYVRDGQRIYPGTHAGWWAYLRHDLFNAIWKWWWWVDVYLGRRDRNEQ